MRLQLFNLKTEHLDIKKTNTFFKILTFLLKGGEFMELWALQDAVKVH